MQGSFPSSKEVTVVHVNSVPLLKFSPAEWHLEVTPESFVRSK
jgi:hypothetical protein